MSLERFVEAQQHDYATALSEIRGGRKRSHWMWYIFPQIEGLGFSDTSKRYAVKDRNEAIRYMNHPLLGKRLVEISTALLQLDTGDPHDVFGSPDDLKLKSSMTLFASLPGADPIFRRVLQKFFNNEWDDKTVRLMGPGEEK